MSETDYANSNSSIHVVILASFSILSLIIVPGHFKGIFMTAQSRLRSEGPNIEAIMDENGVGFLGRGSQRRPIS